MNVEIGAEAALFPKKEYISGIFLTVYTTSLLISTCNNTVIYAERYVQRSVVDSGFRVRILLFKSGSSSGSDPEKTTPTLLIIHNIRTEQGIKLF